MANYLCEIALVEGPLALDSPFDARDAGAIVNFFGNVRPLENGAPISGLDYEAHHEMAQHQLRMVAQEAAKRFDLFAVRLHHRIGFVPSGETSLFLQVGAAHRGAAFAASQWIVDELKKRVPIWKSPTFQNVATVTEKQAIAATA